MIFVSNGGGQYVFFQRTLWNGLSVADLILPLYILIFRYLYIIYMQI